MPERGRQPGGNPVPDDEETRFGCERYRNILGLDETAIPAEMGLYFDFSVDENMIPYGCDGWEKFNRGTWWGIKEGTEPWIHK
eukprot:UN18015